MRRSSYLGRPSFGAQFKAPDVSPFGSYVKRIDALYNKPHKLLADKDAIYVLTEDDAA